MIILLLLWSTYVQSTEYEAFIFFTVFNMSLLIPSFFKEIFLVPKTLSLQNILEIKCAVNSKINGTNKGFYVPILKLHSILAV